MVTVADLASYLDIPVFSWVSNMPELDDKRVKSTLVRTVAPISSLSEILLFVCERMSWYTLAMISTRDVKSVSMASFFRSSINREDNRFYLTREFNMVDVAATEEDIREMYAAIKTEARVIVLVVPSNTVRRYMVTADYMGLTGGDYQFLYTERTIADENFLKRFTDTVFWKLGQEDDERARRAYHNLLYFTYNYAIYWLQQSGKEAAQRLFGSDPSIPEAADKPDKYAKFLHDSVYLYGVAFNQSMTFNSSIVPKGNDIFYHSQNQSFIGKSGVFLTNHKADRQAGFIIWDMDEEDVFRRVIVAQYDLSQKLTLTLVDNILWGNNQYYNTSKGIYIPPDKPQCGLNDEFCQKGQSTQITQ
ncbi:guanylate cyclase [Plakobranchus ocellatus]|uniref:Guanylate cyclase n=1 Tax=Plakobranchus ocellatus TaxID=259542 RepID=A0AAV4DC44_9GAST|nr:guanylate cyclase [Plakobranchus ocellatus]